MRINLVLKGVQIFEEKQIVRRSVELLNLSAKEPRHNFMQIGFQRNGLNFLYVVAFGILNKSLNRHNPP